MSSVDIVVPCYNYARYLEFCVHSVLSQRDVDVRVLIIDDASPDNTPEVAGWLVASDNRVQYIRNKSNLGLIGTANKGVMDWAAADYVVLLSADDALTPGSLARATQLMDERPEISLTYGMALMMHDDGPELKLEDAPNPEVMVISGKQFLRLMCEHGNTVPTPTAVLRTSIQHLIGGYNPLFRHTSDVNMWMRVATTGSVGVINAVQGLYRWHTSNMSAPYQRRPPGDRAEMLDTCRYFQKHYANEFPEFNRWLENMERRFGDELFFIASKCFEKQGDVTWRSTLELAKQCRHDYWKSPAWWKLVFKRLLGQRFTSIIQHQVQEQFGIRFKSADNQEKCCEHGLLIGGWPGAYLNQEDRLIFCSQLNPDAQSNL